MKKRLVVLATLISLLFAFSAVASAEEERAATPASKTYGEALFDLGLIQGSDKGLNESGYLNRAEMVTILNRLDTRDSSDFIAPKVATFSDVPTTHWAFYEVEKAYANGLTTGIGNGKFGVTNKVTHQQAVTFLARIIGYELNFEYAVSEAGEIGINLVEEKDLKAHLYRSDVFELMAKTLTTNVKDTEEVLVKQLKVEEVKANAFMDDYHTIYDHNMEDNYEAEFAEFLKEVLAEQQANAAEIKKLVNQFAGKGENMDYTTFFNLVKEEDEIRYYFNWSTYRTADEWGEDYGIMGQTSVSIDKSGELYAGISATEGKSGYGAHNPIVKKYGTATIDGLKVQLYLVELTLYNNPEAEPQTMKLYFLVDSKGVYKVASIGDWFGDGIYTRE